MYNVATYLRFYPRDWFDTLSMLHLQASGWFVFGHAGVLETDRGPGQWRCIEVQRSLVDGKVWCIPPYVCIYTYMIIYANVYVNAYVHVLVHVYVNVDTDIDIDR